MHVPQVPDSGVNMVQKSDAHAYFIILPFKNFLWNKLRVPDSKSSFHFWWPPRRHVHTVTAQNSQKSSELLHFGKESALAPAEIRHQHGWKEDDYKKEFRSLDRELQLHILKLADVLVDRPSQYARRVEDISLIFKNIHHLLNSLRPHQARATLIHILKDIGVETTKDIEYLPAPPERKATQKYRGDVSYFICTRPGSGPA